MGSYEDPRECGIPNVRNSSNGAFEYFSVPPGARPVPDNQGNLDVCTPFAMAKAIGDGFMRKIFVRGEEVDINQSAVTGILLNEYKDGVGRWPNEFNGKEFFFQDTKGRYWKSKLAVSQVNVGDFIVDITHPQPSNTYVIVYPVDPRYPNREKHCVYAERFDKNLIHCINSHPNDPRPRVNIDGVGLSYFQISCSPQEIIPESIWRELEDLDRTIVRKMEKGKILRRETRKFEKILHDLKNRNNRYRATIVKLRQGSGKDLQGMARKAKGLKA